MVPYATIPDFEIFGAETRSSTGAGTIMFLPLLTNSQDLAQWNTYSQLNTGWIERSRSFQLGSHVEHGEGDNGGEELHRERDLEEEHHEGHVEEDAHQEGYHDEEHLEEDCLLYTSPSPRDLSTSRMPSSA